MTGMQTTDRARQRLVVLVEHLIEHTKDHAGELTEAQGALPESAAAMGLLDKALTDLATAQRALGAYLDCVIAGG